MIGVLGGLSLAIGSGVHEWVAMPRAHMMRMIRDIPGWDYNQTCVQGRIVKFSGESAHFGLSEVQAWNTAVMLALENGVAPPFISTHGQICG